MKGLKIIVFAIVLSIIGGIFIISENNTINGYAELIVFTLSSALCFKALTWKSVNH